MEPGKLKAIPIFSSLDEHQLRLILSKCRQLSKPKGAVILRQDEESYDLYYIIEGDVQISLVHEDGREVLLDTLHQGDFFGELSFIDNKVRSAMATALTSATMLFLPRKHFLEILRENGDIGVAILSVLVKRLRKANSSIETLTFLDVAGRVSKLLMEHAEAEGEKNADGSTSLRGLTHQRIARQIGASREAVTKALKSLAAKGLIRVRRSEIIIPRQRHES